MREAEASAANQQLGFFVRAFMRPAHSNVEYEQDVDALEFFAKLKSRARWRRTAHDRS